ncbi:MAG TPA: squalene--hopene cyclase [Bryobacteraceae bacterium]|nr:squalene--hopene cyclase [Bryobacteraceae bacterium]
MSGRFEAALPSSSLEAQAHLAVRDFRRMQERIQAATASAAGKLLELQAPEGYWCGELTADTTLESDYILLQLWLYPPEKGVWHRRWHPHVVKSAASVLQRQLPDGGWNIHSGGPAEVNATARAYVALKLAGFDPDEPRMARARNRVLALGGLQACNSYTKINLSFFGLYARQYVPSVPPEIMLVPGNLLYEMSSWTRAIIVPLSIVQALSGVRPVPEGFSLDELCVRGKKLTMPRRDRFSAAFCHADRVVKLWERRGLDYVRRNAIRQAEDWMLARFRFSDGLGAIYPSIMYSIMAMDALNYERDQPDFAEALWQFERLIMEREDTLRFQPCLSPVWDTAIAAFALGESGQVPEGKLTETADWLLAREIRRKGDWSVKRPDLRPSGWAFEFNNEYYPDIDDTAMVLLALQHARASDPIKQAAAEDRAIRWLLGMQSADGGWAAFDVDNNWQVLNKVPFADHNAMLDPTCPDITGRVLEALCKRGFTPAHPAIERAIDYLLNQQKPDGSWFGRWGVNYIYGTFLALRGLRASGSLRAEEAIRKGGEFLARTQNEDGSWGESCASYVSHHFVAGPATASQTSWALLGLIAAGEGSSGAIRRGLDWLLRTQKADGSWDEPQTTGTGFPGVFYLTYHLYRQYFPLLALAACRTGKSAAASVA